MKRRRHRRRGNARQRACIGAAALARGVWLASLLALFAAAAASPVASAQTVPDSTGADAAQAAREAEAPRYTLAFLGVPLERALERIIDETEIDLAYAPERASGRRSHCRAERLRTEKLLGCVLDGTGLSYARLASGTYVLVTDPHTPPQRGRLSGQVVDAETGIPLAGANVLLAASGGGTSTGASGRFSFPALKPGPHRLIVTHVAYRDTTRAVRVRPHASERARVALRPRTVRTAPVVVSGLASRLPSAALESEERAVPGRNALAGAGGAGVTGNLGDVPGVHATEARSSLHIQGGAAGDQAVRLGGAPVFTPVPNGGLVGSFSPLAVGRVEVQKAGFGAARGSHLSGVVDARHQMPSGDAPALSARVTPLSVDARATGRLRRGERSAAFMIAGRKSLWNLYQPGPLETLFRDWGSPDGFLLQALDAGGAERSEAATGSAGTSLPADGPLEMQFSDLHAAARVRLGGLRSASGSFYRGSGRFGVEGRLASGPAAGEEFEDQYDWTTYAAHLGYEWVPSGRLFARAEAWGASYTFGHAFEPSPAGGAGRDNFNEIREAGLRLEGNYALAERHHLTGAVEAAFTESDFALSLRPGASPLGPEALRPVRGRAAGFLEDEVTLSDRWRLTPGLRLTYLPAQAALYSEPRLALRYDRPAGEGSSSGAWGARAAVGRYRQYRSSFDVATAGTAQLLPRVRYWLPLGQDQRPPEAYHAALSGLYRTGGAPWALRAEVYYKHQPHLRALAFGVSDENKLFAEADGYAYGVSLKAERTAGTVQGEAYYEYAVARRRVEGRFGGRLLPAPWSAPHRLHLGLDVALTPRLTATLRWKGLFGRPWGFRQAYYDLLASGPATDRFPPFDLSRPSAHRLPAFSQWDVGLGYARDVGRVTVQAEAALVNALGRANVTSWSLRAPGEAGGAYERDARHAVPRYPTFSVQVRW